MNRLIDDKTNPTFVLCIGMKRSGSTLQYNMSKFLLENQFKTKNFGYIDGKDLSKKLPNEETLKANFLEYIILKCHNPPWEVGSEFLKNHKILYIYRDLRAVYFSMKIRQNYSLDEFILEMKKSLDLYSNYEKDSRVFVQKYEDVFLNNKDALLDISKYLQVKVNDNLITKILKLVSIESSKNNHSFFKKIITFIYRFLINIMSKKFIIFLKKILFMPKLISIFKKSITPISDNLMYTDHVSKFNGNPMIWKKKLSTNEISRIELEFNGWLKEHGYL